jgi:hypothetical protein
MAIRGVKPTATVVKLARGNPGRRPLPQQEPLVTGDPAKRKMSAAASKLWDELMECAPWLGRADSYKIKVFCELYVEFEMNPQKMPAPRIGRMMAAGSELGLDPSSRARIGTIKPTKQEEDPAERFFG